MTTAANPNISLISISVFPLLVQDVADRMDKWGDDGMAGRIDPFTEVYDVSGFFGTTYCLGQRREFLFSSFSP